VLQGEYSLNPYGQQVELYALGGFVALAPQQLTATGTGTGTGIGTGTLFGMHGLE
jgi:hypothetical protein